MKDLQLVVAMGIQLRKTLPEQIATVALWLKQGFSMPAPPPRQDVARDGANGLASAPTRNVVPRGMRCVLAGGQGSGLI